MILKLEGLVPKVDHVCFTGAAHYPDGTPIIRWALKKAAQKAGFIVHDQMSSAVQMLVASKNNTAKAKAAFASGVVVVDYGFFVAHLVNVCGVVIPGGQPSKFNKYVDDPSLDPANEDELEPGEPKIDGVVYDVESGMYYDLYGNQLPLNSPVVALKQDKEITLDDIFQPIPYGSLL